MPIYEYKCTQCRLVFEEFQSVGATGEKLKCPSCGAPAPEKMFSAFASCGSQDSGSGNGGSHSCGSGGFG